jgi:hypothetical protein
MFSEVLRHVHSRRGAITERCTVTPGRVTYHVSQVHAKLIFSESQSVRERWVVPDHRRILEDTGDTGAGGTGGGGGASEGESEREALKEGVVPEIALGFGGL